MNIESKLSGHWTDEELINHLYGVGPDNGHFGECRECQQRFLVMQSVRRSIEQHEVVDDEISFEFLAAQRRAIYARLEKPVRWWSGLHARRWASAAAAVAVIGGGLAMFEEAHPFGSRQPVAATKISDAQLASEVSQIADSGEPQPTAPLQGLFEE